MMPHIYHDDHGIALVEPDNTDIHVDTALKKVSYTLDTLCTQ